MDQPSISSLAGRYKLLSPLGQGGMGRVWKAHDQLLGRDVALKEIAPDGVSAAELGDLRERAIREARAIARIDHPHVVRIFDVVEHEGSPWIVMELIRARSLFDVVNEDGPLEPARVARIGLDVLGALRAAHRAGILHRDVKPANVLVGVGGRVVLTDFGLAMTAGDSAMTRTGVMLGSPSYLAPERARDEPASAKSDLWSLGATMFAAVEGKPPYQRSSPMTTLAALMVDPPATPERAGLLEPVLEALLEKDPAARATAEEAADLLHYVLAEASPPQPSVAAVLSHRGVREPVAQPLSSAETSGVPAVTGATTPSRRAVALPPPAKASYAPSGRPPSAKPSKSGQVSAQAAPSATPAPVKATTTVAPKPAPVVVSFEAESYTDNHGTEDSFPDGASGGRVVGKTDNGDYVGYGNRSLAGMRKVSLRYAAGDGATEVAIRAGSGSGAELARVTLPGTGNFQTYATVTATLTAAGSGAPYLVFLGPKASDIDVVTLST
ncbi:protein kinase domain-containing protein [Paractinoplanes atraurantiacus]|uniref:non-specific serine/threonine protein kinase n=1 Tax=Paractinoplanes atraurantiacus TaxID=1036182 RepID=A0A285JKW9_9ACTN|nr:protein kinase [Actinoplanes atraurantiacus]SNY60908.1 Serine/threonine protein kinase [Actinoplanes atraurantiacus]